MDSIDPPVTQPDRPPRERIINAPTIVILMAGLLVALHGAFSFSAYETQVNLQYDYALVPRRFWAESGSQDAYPSLAAGLLTLLSTGFLHVDWMHVIVNSAMLLAFGTPVARALGGGMGGAGKWMLVYLGSVIAGSAAYLALNGVDAGTAVGASGGTSGLMAAALLVDPRGGLRSPFSREFLGFTAAFAVVNVILVLAGPSLLGSAISWEAHAGGYVAGGLLMLLTGRRAVSPPERLQPPHPASFMRSAPYMLR